MAAVRQPRHSFRWLGGSGASNYGAAGYLLNNTIARNGGPAVDLWGQSVAIVGRILTAPDGSPVLRCRGPFTEPWDMANDVLWNAHSAPLYAGESGPCGVAAGTSGVTKAGHHVEPSVNLGFYTSMWDRLFGTLDPEYDQRRLAAHPEPYPLLA